MTIIDVIIGRLAVQKNKRFLEGWGRISVLVVLVFWVGCGDTQKRATGKKLREATQEAQGLYDKAQNILSNPQIVDSEVVTDSLSPQVLVNLNKAEKALTGALRKYYDADKSDPEKVSSVDAGMAKMTLGQIRHLRGRYYGWSAKREIRKARGVTHQIYEYLKKVRLENTSVLAYQERLSQTGQQIAKDQEAAKKAKADASRNRDTVKTQIQNLQKEIASLEKRIQQNNSKASSLKQESNLTTGRKSLQKLEEALQIENLIHKDRGRIRQLNSGLVRQQDKLAEADLELSGINSKLAAIREIREQHSIEIRLETEKLKEEKKNMAATCEKIAELLAELGKNCTETFDLAAKADSAFWQAEKDIVSAGNLVSRDKKAQALSEEEGVRASSAEVQSSRRDFRVEIEELFSRITNVWEGLHDEKPPAPESAEITDFMEKTKTSGDTEDS